MKRFLRDSGILVSFCGAFYLLIILVGRLDGESNLDSNEFSPIRVRADAFIAEQNWESAIAEYESLTKQDPYNGHAWDRLATSILELRRNAIFELDDLPASADREAATEIANRISEVSDRAFVVLKELSRFARYRPRALLQMAVIDCYRGNYNQAMDHLEEFLERGYTTKFGLSHYPAFGVGEEEMVLLETRNPSNVRLHAEERFWYLVRKERDIDRRRF